MPPISFSIVVLPEPFGPSSPTRSPRSIAIETSSMTRGPLLRYATEALVARSMGAGTAAADQPQEAGNRHRVLLSASFAPGTKDAPDGRCPDSRINVSASASSRVASARLLPRAGDQ